MYTFAIYNTLHPRIHISTKSLNTITPLHMNISYIPKIANDNPTQTNIKHGQTMQSHLPNPSSNNEIGFKTAVSNTVLSTNMVFADSDSEDEDLFDLFPDTDDEPNLHDMPADVLHYIFAFVGSGHFLFISQTCHRLLMEYTEVWPEPFTLIRMAAASITCVEWAIKWYRDFDYPDGLTFLISGAV